MATDTRRGEVVIENSNITGFLGVTYVADNDGCGAIVNGWERLPSGKFGPVQKHGGVHIGDALYSVNDSIITQLPFENVKIMMSNDSIVIRKLKFISADEHYRRKRGVIRQPSGISTSGDSVPVFQSLIRQYRTCEVQKGKGNSFIEYEIACQLRISNSTRLETTQMLKWTVWRRYSQFESLHKSVVSEFGWQAQSLEEFYPPSHTFAWDKFSMAFLEQRREELNRYWTKLLEIHRIADFEHKQHSSASLFAFLEVEVALASAPPPAPTTVTPSRDPRPAAPPRVSNFSSRSTTTSPRKDSFSSKPIDSTATSPAPAPVAVAVSVISNLKPEGATQSVVDKKSDIMAQIKNRQRKID